MSAKGSRWRPKWSKRVQSAPSFTARPSGRPGPPRSGLRRRRGSGGGGGAAPPRRILLGHRGRREVDHADIFEPGPVDKRLDAHGAVLHGATPTPTGRPGGSTPPWPEVTTRSPISTCAVGDRKISRGAVELSPAAMARSRVRFDDHRDARVEVGEQQHARRALADLDHAADRPSAVTTAWPLATPSSAAGIDQRAAHERAAGVGDDARGDEGGAAAAARN